MSGSSPKNKLTYAERFSAAAEPVPHIVHTCPRFLSQHGYGRVADVVVVVVVTRMVKRRRRSEKEEREGGARRGRGRVGMYVSVCLGK